MHVLYFVHQCTIMYACAVSIALGWPFTQHKTQLKPRKHELKQSPGLLSEVISRPHSKYEPQKQKVSDRNGKYPHSNHKTDESFIGNSAMQNPLIDTKEDEDYIQRRSQKRHSYSISFNPGRIEFPQASQPKYSIQHKSGRIRFRSDDSGSRDDFLSPLQSKGINNPASTLLKGKKHKKHENCQLENGTKLIPCRSNKSQCLRDDMICDDHKDCDGGEDEDAGSCLLRNWVIKRLREIEDVIHNDKNRN